MASVPPNKTQLGGTTQPVDSTHADFQEAYALELVSGIERSWQTPSIFVLRGKRVRVGRLPRTSDDPIAETNDVVLPQKSVSARHAVLERGGKTWWCNDDGSSGGTFVNDAKLGPGDRIPLQPGDRVRFGPRVTLVCRGVAEGREEVARELPSPLARLESALEASAERSRRASVLFHDLDRALRFLSACTLAWLRREALVDHALRARLASALARPEFTANVRRGGLSMGTWASLFMSLTKLLPDDPSPLVSAARLVREEMGLVDDAIKQRNLWAHAHVPSDAELERAEPELEQLVTALLRAFAPFVGLPLVSVARTDNLVEGYRYGIYVLRGNERARLETLECPAKMLGRWCYLLDAIGDPGTERPLLLAPLVAADETREGWKVHLASRIDLGPKGSAVELTMHDEHAEPMHLAIPWVPDVAALFEAGVHGREKA